MDKQEEYVTATEAWHLMGVSNATLARMIAAGEVPTYPHPRHKQRKMIPKSFIDTWLEDKGPPIKRGPRKRPVSQDERHVQAA